MSTWDEDEFGFESANDAKRWLRRALSIAPAKFAALWTELNADGVVTRAVEGDITRQVFTDEARLYAKTSNRVKKADRRKGRAKSSQSDDYPMISPKERLRASAYSEYVALQSDRDDEVVKLRRRLTNGRLVTNREAECLMSSPAARLLRLREMQILGVPLFDHEASSRALPYGLPTESPIDGRMEVKINWKRKSVTTEAILKDANRRAHVPMPFAISRGPFWGQKGAWITVWPESVLDEIRFVAHRLSETNSWRELDAVRFLLTGFTPQIEPLRDTLGGQHGRFIGSDGLPGKSHAFMRRTVTIEVDTWVNPDLVKAIFMRHRRSSGAPIGETKDQKLTDARTMEVFRFVVRVIRQAGGGRPKWQELLEKWNKEHDLPDRYLTMRTFRNAYFRGKVSVAFLGIEHWAKLVVD